MNFAVDFIAELLQQDKEIFSKLLSYTVRHIENLKAERELYDNDYDVVRTTIYRLEDKLGEDDSNLEVISDLVSNDNQNIIL